MEFLNNLFEFLFSPGQRELTNVPNAHLVFATASAFMGLMVVALDLIIFLLQRKSVLKLTYQGYRTVLVLVLWGIGAGLVGLLGGAFKIFQLTLQASVSVGVAWPVILPRLIKSTQADEDTQLPSTEE